MLLDRRVTQFGDPLTHLVSESIHLVVAHLHRRRAEVTLLLGGVCIRHGDEGFPYLLISGRLGRRPQDDGQLIEDLPMLGKMATSLLAACTAG